MVVYQFRQYLPPSIITQFKDAQYFFSKICGHFGYFTQFKPENPKISCALYQMDYDSKATRSIYQRAGGSHEVREMYQRAVIASIAHSILEKIRTIFIYFKNKENETYGCRYRCIKQQNAGCLHLRWKEIGFKNLSTFNSISITLGQVGNHDYNGWV